MKFSIRSVLVTILLLGLLFGWSASSKQAERRYRRLSQQLTYAEEELSRARDEVREIARGKVPDPQRSFWESSLDGSNLADTTVVHPGNIFQKASFRGCKLERATLKGGASSFQRACFDGATLINATLVGGVSSFQSSSFVDADLTDARLDGGPSSFQLASFENADMTGVTLKGSFQLVNLSRARLQRADLSALDAYDLASAYFDKPPTYDAQTKFPAGFEPREQLWRLVD